MHDKYKTCKNCAERTAQPNCHDSCEGYLYRKLKCRAYCREIKSETDYKCYKHSRKIRRR